MNLSCIWNIVLLALLTTASTVTAEDWPQWRGGKLDSVSSETGLPDSLSEENRLWRVEMPGPAGSSPIVSGDKIFVASVDGDGLALLCVDTTGKVLWNQKLKGKNKKVRMDRGNYASPSPVTDGEHVWVMLADGILHCFTTDGELQWTKEMQKEYGKFQIQFGMSSTPLLDKGKLYFQFIHGSMRDDKTSKGKLVSLDAKTGNENWVYVRKTDGTKENKHAYSSPTMFRNGDREFLIIHGADYATGHSLADGEEMWRVGGLNPPSSYNAYLRFVSSPVCSDELIVVPSAKNGPVVAFTPDVEGDIKNKDERIRWKMKKGTPDVATPLISNDRVYLARENGVLICVDAKNGEELYEHRLLRDKHRSTPVAADGKIYLIGRDGTAAVVADSPEFKLISESALGEETTSSPAISDGRIFVRTNKSLMAFGKK